MNAYNKAVITCDLINSSKYEVDDRNIIISRMKEFVNKWNDSETSEYLIYRGDSMQGLIHDPSQALKQAIFLKSFIKSVKLRNSKRSTNADIRISIGIGEIDYKGIAVLESDGEAFQNSGRTLDVMKRKGRSLALTTSDPEQNSKWEVILLLMEDVIEQWTIQSAEIIWRLIDGWNEKGLKEHFKISQPAISLRKKHASWEAISKTINYYEKNFKQ